MSDERPDLDPATEPTDALPVTAPSTVPDDGRRRRRMAAAVLVVAVGCAAGGVLIGRQLQSPEDAAADRAAPRPSRITAAVERRELSSSLTVAGEIQFAEPTPIKLAGSVGLGEGETGLLTRLPERDQSVEEGDALFDVSGRPVLVVEGAMPMYRSLGPGSTGADVEQLEQALERLGLSPGTVDTVYDAATEAAVDALYLRAGYTSIGASAEDLERLRTLRLQITSAESTLTSAQQNLEEAGKGPSGAELLQLQQQLANATDQLPVAQARAERDNKTAQQQVQTATTTRDNAVRQRDLAKSAYDVAKAPGAVDPSTGEPFSPDEINTRAVTLASAEQALNEAQLALAVAEDARTTTAEQAKTSVLAAQQAKALAKATLDDATRPKDTTTLRQAVTEAQAALDQARVELADADARIGTRIPAGELVFVPTLPSTVTNIQASLGGPASDVLATVSSTATHVVGRLSRADGDLVKNGAAVTIDLRDFDVQMPGTVTFVGQPPSSDGDSGSGRLQVVVEADDPNALADYVFSSVRIIVAVASTGGTVLAVPIAAVTLGGDGESRVEIERAPVTATDDGQTEFVEVEVGLSAAGLVEISSLSASHPIEEGDRVVLGVDSGRVNSGADDAGTDSAAPASEG